MLLLYMFKFCTAFCLRKSMEIEEKEDREILFRLGQIESRENLMGQEYASRRERAEAIRLQMAELQPQNNNKEITKSGFKLSVLQRFVEHHVKTISYEKDENDINAENEICGICNLEFYELEHVKHLDCKTDLENAIASKHIFHDTCILNWFKISVDCPICRCDFANDIKTIKRKSRYEI